MSTRRKGGGATWMRSRYRFRFISATYGPWYHAGTLADIKADAQGQPVEVQRYDARAETYSDHSTINTPTAKGTA